MIHRTRVAFYRVALILVALAVLCACDGQAKQDAQATEVAQALHGTQTAMAPTATMPPTETPVPTATVTPPPTMTPTITPTPSPVPLTVGEVFELMSPSVAFVDTGTVTGSGVLIDGGYLLTNAHVVWPYSKARIVFADGTEILDAPIAHWDLLADLALVGPLVTDLAPLELVGREDLPVASDVVLIGYPGEAEDYPQPTVSRGVLSRMREWEALGISYFQTDASIAGGQSGGVLASDRGEVIGITGFMYTDAFGLAASSEDILPRIEAMIAGEDVTGLGPRAMPTGVGLRSSYVELEAGEIQSYVVDEPLNTEITFEIDSDARGALLVMPAYMDDLLALSTVKGADTRGSITVENPGPHFVILMGDIDQPSTLHVSCSHDMRLINDLDDKAKLDLPKDERTLSIGETITGNIDHPLDVDFIAMELDRGDIVDITVSSVLVDPHIVVSFEGATEQEIVLDDDEGGGLFGLDAKLTYLAPQTGNYGLRINGGLLDVGGYHVRLQEAPADATPAPTRPAPTPTPGVAKSTYGDMAYWHSERGPFGMRRPVKWELDEEATEDYFGEWYEDSRNRMLMFYVEPADGLSTQEYADEFVEDLEDESNTKVYSRKTRETEAGLEYEVVRCKLARGVYGYTMLAVARGHALTVQFLGSSLTTLNNISKTIYYVFDSLEIDEAVSAMKQPTPIPEASDDAVTLRTFMTVDPQVIDPTLTIDGTSLNIIEQLFLGLTDFDDDTGEVIPELATKWTVSKDGLTWTFQLRNDVYWVRYDADSGEAKSVARVTASDVVYGLKRALNPENRAPMASVDYVIKNAEKLHTGKSRQWSSLGVKALNELTVQFTLEHPAPYFPAIAGMAVNRPVPYKPIGEHGNQWTAPENLWSNGPYVLAARDPDKSWVMVKNQTYYAAPEVQIERIEWSVVSAQTAQEMYLDDGLDIAYPMQQSLDKHPRLTDEIDVVDRLRTTYIGFNTTKAPFDDPRVRLAFAMATDKSLFGGDGPIGSVLEAVSFGGPGIAGSPAEDKDYEGLAYDPKAARALLKEAGYPNGRGLPEIIFGYSEGLGYTATALRNSWEENLGVRVTLRGQSWSEHSDQLEDDAPQMFTWGWAADYPDEHNFVYNVCHPTKGLNHGQWQPDAPGAEEFMDAVEDAASESDQDERARLYREAETILCVEQAVIVPLYHAQEAYLCKPRLHRTYAQFGGEHIHRWTISEE